ncbi:MAG: quinone oxidoreductase [Microbacteriaceae bacterium]
MSNYEAIVVEHYGGPEVLVLDTQHPMPSPAAGEILVEVAAVGVNFIETYQRSGVYQVPLPNIPGSEFSGTVAALGEGVHDFQLGDRVMTSTGRYAYGQYAIVSAAGALKVPEQVDLTEAAAIPLQGITAHYLLRSVFEVKPGHTVLIHAGAGGVGQLLIQLSLALGATVITTASTAAKRQIAQDLGAHHVIAYENFPDEVRRITHGLGVDVVYDGVGKETYQSSIASLRARGHIAIFGAASGPVPPFDIQLLNKAGSVTLSRPSIRDFLQSREELDWRSEELFGFLQAGKLHFAIGGRYPLAQAAQAHYDLESRNTTGKLLLIPARTG